jgi:hypothetical protein
LADLLYIQFFPHVNKIKQLVNFCQPKNSDAQNTATRTRSQATSLFKSLNHQAQFENCLTFSLLSRYLIY